MWDISLNADHLKFQTLIFLLIGYYVLGFIFPSQDPCYFVFLFSFITYFVLVSQVSFTKAPQGIR